MHLQPIHGETSMDRDRQKNPIVIGLAGSFGSGCSYIANNILAKAGFTKVSLSEILRKRYRKERGSLARLSKADERQRLQDFGDEIRMQGAGWLAHEAIKGMQRKWKSAWVVDSIRNPGEIQTLRNHSSNFFLFGIYADLEERWRRSKSHFNGNRALFEELDEIDKGYGSEPHGQRVADSFYESDVVLSNTKHIEAIGNKDFETLKGNVLAYVDLIKHPLTKRTPIRAEEVFMAMAYAASQRSSCLKRKVGAVIVDQMGNVIASGYNTAPTNERSCEDRFQQCYRDHVLGEFFQDIKRRIPEIREKEDDLRRSIRNRFKMLDICRALHAEENAILALSRTGNPDLEKCTLYTTTYPCNMCANRISSLGIRKVIYVEPYPQPEAKAILRNAGVEDQFFEGLTHRAYFRLYGERR